jgi:hypothetical protein
MLSELLRRRQFCSSQEIDKFYNHLPRNSNLDCNYSWDITPDGCFVHGYGSVTYLRYIDGQCFRLVRWFHPKDCEMMKDVYNISLDTGHFRSEQLITYDIVQYNGEEYLYYETRRPNSEFGLTGIEEAISTSTTEFFTTFIDQVAVILPYLGTMSKKYGYGHSLTNLQIASNRALDSKGHYWKNLKMFKYPADKIVEQSLEMLVRSVQFVQQSKKETLEVAPILDYATDKWKFSQV